MRHCLLVDERGHSQTMWLPIPVSIGSPVRWNGTTYRVSAVYGTHFSMEIHVHHRDRPPHQHDEQGLPEIPEVLN